VIVGDGCAGPRTFHSDRPRFGLGAISSTDGPHRLFPGTLGANFGAADPATEYDLARFIAHGRLFHRLLPAAQRH
jgi:hypothetical protein